MVGFDGLVKRRFQGNEAMAKEYVADLGRAAYFYRTKPQIAVNVLKPYYYWIPELFILTDGQVTDIAWRSEYMRQKGTY